MATDEVKDSIFGLAEEKIISDVRPKLLEIDPVLDAIFIYCTEIEIVDIHNTVMIKEYHKYWESTPVIVFFDLSSSLTANIIDKCSNIIDTFKENITTIAIFIGSCWRCKIYRS